jgi:hypothetical protein
MATMRFGFRDASELPLRYRYSTTCITAATTAFFQNRIFCDAHHKLSGRNVLILVDVPDIGGCQRLRSSRVSSVIRSAEMTLKRNNIA